MPRFYKKLSKTVGLPPGALIHIGEKKTENIKISIIDYDETHFLEKKEIKTIEESFSFRDTSTVTWINIDGIHEIDVIGKLGEYFGLHPLIQEDILNTDQRPKIDDFGSYIFIALKMLDYDESKDEVKSEQVSLVLGSNFVISLQEREGDVFNPVRERIRNNKSRIRKMGADYLAYSLIDSIVDNYFVVLEKLGEGIENAEEDLIKMPATKTLRTIGRLKKEMIFLRKSVWPLREVIGGLEKIETPLVQKSTQVYLRDVYDHTIQVIDVIEDFRDLAAGMLDIYLSSVSNRMNEVMKVLTMFASIFIPLTFIAGVYGMNFTFMPELAWRWGYPAVLTVMALVAIFLLFYFKRKKWF